MIQRPVAPARRLGPHPLAFPLALALTLLAARAQAQAQDQDQDRPFDDRTVAALRAMANHFDQARAFAVNVDLNAVRATGDNKRLEDNNARFLIQKPDKFRIDFTANGAEGFVVSDGQTRHTVHKTFGQFTRKQVSEKRPLEHGLMQMLFGGTLIHDKPYAAIRMFVDGGRHVGTEKIDGHDAQRLVLDARFGEIQLWLTTDENPRPLKLKMHRTTDPDRSLKVEVRFSRWDFNPEIADDAFAFEPGDGLTEVEEFASPSPRRLIGKPAPRFTLKTLDGKTVELADHLGKDVVILDFWATWCAPCIRGLPVVKAVYDDLKDRNIAFYAVNLKESADQIRRFQEKFKTDLPILLDADGKVANEYLASPLPQTVLIGPDGNVRAVHSGITDDTEYKLKRELKALLDGKPLP